MVLGLSSSKRSRSFSLLASYLFHEENPAAALALDDPLPLLDLPKGQAGNGHIAAAASILVDLGQRVQPVFLDLLIPVSYTHLDVYKRQSSKDTHSA